VVDGIVMQLWSELLKKQRREMLIEHIQFTTGVTTLVAESGEGKTTLAMAIAMTVATGGMWGDKRIKQRPVFWVAGEGRDDLRPMYEGWMGCHPGCGEPAGGFYEEPIDLSSWLETDKLIKMLDGLPPALIVTDALADMIGILNEDSSKDINQVYRNVWRVVQMRSASFLIPHHSGWEGKRERGSTAIRAKSDIVVKIKSFDPGAGMMNLEHLKRRGGAKQKDFHLETKLIPIVECSEPVPVIMGPPGPDALLNQNWAADGEHARGLVQIMVAQPKSPVRHKDLMELSGKPKTTFKRGLDEAKRTGWLIWLKDGYALNPDGCWRAALGMAGSDFRSGSGSNVGPYGGPDLLDLNGQLHWTYGGPRLDPGPNPQRASEDNTTSGGNGLLDEALGLIKPEWQEAVDRKQETIDRAAAEAAGLSYEEYVKQREEQRKIDFYR
jgi:hypothetical protein